MILHLHQLPAPPHFVVGTVGGKSKVPSYTEVAANLLVALNVHSNLLRLTRDERGGGGGMGTYVLPPTRYTVTTRMNLL